MSKISFKFPGANELIVCSWSLIAQGYLNTVEQIDRLDPARVTSNSVTLIPAWICHYIHYNVWDEITYPFLNFNGAAVEV